MADESTLDSTQKPVEGQNQTSDGDLQANEDEQSSGANADEVTALKEQVAGLQKAFSTLQSGKDRGINEVRKELQSLEEKLLKGVELTPEQSDQLWRNRVEARLFDEGVADTSSSQAQAESSSAQPAASLEYAAILQNGGIDPNSVEGLGLVAKFKTDPMGLMAAVVEHATKGQQSDNPSEAATNVAGGRTTKKSDLPDISNIEDSDTLYNMAREFEIGK